jgi:hypothetical protein
MEGEKSQTRGWGSTDRHYLFVIQKENILGLSRLPGSTLLILLIKADSGQAKFWGSEGGKVVAHCFHYGADEKKNESIFFSYAPDIRKSTDLKVPRLCLLVLLTTATD